MFHLDFCFKLLTEIIRCNVAGSRDFSQEGPGAPIRKDVTDGRLKQILKANNGKDGL